MIDPSLRKQCLLSALCFLLILCLVAGCGQRAAEQANPSISIRLVHGPELAKFISLFKQQFDNGRLKISDGRTIAIEPIEEKSLSAAQRIASGELKTEAWFTQSPAFSEYVNSHLSNLGPKQIECDSLFGTPVVIATNSQDRALFAANESAFSWLASVGAYFEFEAKDESNPKYSLVLPAPKSSVSGMASLSQLAYFALRNRANALDQEALKKPATLQKLKQFQSVALNYASDDVTLFQRLASVNRRPGLFALTTEQQLAVFNQSQASANGTLYALYPDEGSVWDQYSLCTSEADWVTPAHRAALRQIREILLAEQGQLLAKQAGFRPAQMVIGELAPLSAQFGVNTSLPKLSLPPISSASMSFLLENWLDIARPAAILFLLDASGSTDDMLAPSKTEIRNWLAQSSKQDLKAIVTFAQQIKSETEFTSDAAKLIETLNVQQSLGGSAVYDALKRGLDLLASRDLLKHRKTLLVVTDGEDKNSQSSLERIENLLEQRMSTTAFNLIVVAVQRGQANLSDLKTLAQISGGLYLEASPANLSAVLQRALAEL